MTSSAPLDTELLRAFVAVVDSGGFSQAAERLLRGQSAVSLQIKRLEARVGFRLLDRGPRHVALTTEGEMILDHARRILALNDELMGRLREPELTGLVRLGAPEDFATSHLPDVLSRFARAYPRVALEMTCELTLELLDRFNAGGLDLALVKREPSVAREGMQVWREPLVWVGSGRGIVQRAGALPLVVSPRPCVYRQRAISSLDAAGWDWRVAYTCGSLAGLLAAVRAGLGVAVLPKEMAPPDLVRLNDEASGLPALDDTEIALITTPSLSAPAERLKDYILRALERD
ncbi:LysR family transcriptional regulator [bacterium]|nr:LysR family transcriptional regulator [bacterium]